jgi:hypothetical protein
MRALDAQVLGHELAAALGVAVVSIEHSGQNRFRAWLLLMSPPVSTYK